MSTTKGACVLNAFTDGACRLSNPGQCSYAFVIYDGDEEIASGCDYLGPELHTNNFAEYQGLIACLRWAYEARVKGMLIHCDSLLVVNQVLSIWRVSPEMEKLAFTARTYFLQGGHSLNHIRGHRGIRGNERADELCNIVLDAVLPRGKKEPLSCIG
jgi:ribonuclease HI